MGNRRGELFNSPGMDDLDSRGFIIKHAPTILGFEVISHKMYGIDLRCKDNPEIGVEIEQTPYKIDSNGHDTSWYGDYWAKSNIPNNILSSLGFPTVNVPERKFHFWEEYERDYGNRYNPSHDKNYFIRIATDFSCVIVIPPHIMLDHIKRFHSRFKPKIGFKDPENFWCYKEEDVLTFLLQEDGTLKLKPYIKEEKNESIPKSNLDRLRRNLHSRENQESQNVFSEQIQHK
jgi:hypothetical protein